MRDLPIVLALLIVAWLTAAAMSVRSVSRIWLRHWTEQRLRGAAVASAYLERPHRLLIGSGIATALTLVLTGVLLGLRAGGATLVADVAFYAAIFVLLGQIVPRAIARRWSASLVPFMMPILYAAAIVATPVVALGRRVAAPLERRRRHGRASVDLERESIQELLREGALEGVGEHDEIEIISGVVKFGAKRVREVMTPRAEIFALDDRLEARTLATRIAQSNYSRVPIYHETLDDVRGMVHAFDVLKANAEELPPLRPIATALPDTPCNELLFRMLRERTHQAIVRDGEGRTVGLVTLEDVLEELVGDIRDEHDEPEASRANAHAPGPVGTRPRSS